MFLSCVKQNKNKQPTIESCVPTQEDLDRRMKWFDNARFGMFIHWGAYSPLSGTWDSVKYQGYGEHIQRMAKIPNPVYREKVVGTFNPVKFNADEWVRMAKDAGMAYLVFTAKHHDGFAMYHSKVSGYNIIDATPFGRDPMRELKDACRKSGLKFGVYYSQAFDWGEENAPGNDWDFDNPGGDKLLGGADWWETRTDFIPKSKQFVDKKVIPQLMEIIYNYQPDLIWFDTPHKLPEEENLRILAAVRQADPDIVINGRAVERCGDYASTWDRPAEFFERDGYWEAIPTTNNSFAYNENDTIYKPASHFIRLLAKAAARGGNILMNIGPRGDGSIDSRDVQTLQEIGKWWKMNGEQSIRGTARTLLAVQSWGESTVKGNTIYLHVFDMPVKGELVVGGLLTEVEKAYFLCNKLNNLETTCIGKDIIIKIPKNEISVSDDVVIALECKDIPMADKRRLLSVNQPVDILRTFDAQLYGNIHYGGEAERQMWVQNWKSTDDKVIWHARLNEPAHYKVYIHYEAPQPKEKILTEGDAGKELNKQTRGAGGTYIVSLGDKEISGKVRKGDNLSEYVGDVRLDAGEFDISLYAKSIEEEELFRPRCLELVLIEN